MCMYTHMCLHRHLDMCMHMYVHMYLHVSLFLPMYEHVHMCMLLNVHMFRYMCMFIKHSFMCVCTGMRKLLCYAHVYVYACARSNLTLKAPVQSHIWLGCSSEVGAKENLE